MIGMDIQKFLDLPDWQKVELKRTQRKFNSYPMQTQKQELDRRVSVLTLCAHFAMKDYDTFIDQISQKTLDGLWPSAMELFVTPKLFDVIPIDLLTNFSYCYCCTSFIGYNKMHYRAVKYSKVTPLYGICKLAKDEPMIERSLIRVNPKQRCVAWNPLRMYEQITDFHIKQFLNHQKTPYSYIDYQRDLKTINIFDYFQNRYNA